MNRALLVLASLIPWGAGVLAYSEARFVGFPDGFVDGFGGARKAVLVSFAFASALVGLGLIGAAVRPRTMRVRHGWVVPAVVYVLVAALVAFLNGTLGHVSGRGG